MSDVSKNEEPEAQSKRKELPAVQKGPADLEKRVRQSEPINSVNPPPMTPLRVPAEDYAEVV